MTEPGGVATDPFARRGFRTGFDHSSGEMMVYGGGFVALLMIIGALTQTGGWMYLLVAVAALALAVYHLPIMRKGLAQLMADERGLTLDGLGTIGWGHIQDARLRNQSVRNIRNAYLDLPLDRPLKECLVAKANDSIYRDLMIKCWEVDRDNVLHIRCEPLKGSPEEILAGVSQYLGR